MTHSLNRRHLLRNAAASIGLNIASPHSPSPETGQPSQGLDFNVRDWGAKGDGVTFDTQAIQAAIDACFAAKGGRVILQGGVFLTRTIRLKSNVTLFLEAGAVLQGTASLHDYEEITPDYVCYTYSSRVLVHAEGAENVTIAGKGAIDLRGQSFPAQIKHTNPNAGTLEWGESPYAVRLTRCFNLTVRDVTIRNCPMTALRIEAAHNAVLDGIRIDNRVRISCDGIEIVSSREVCMSNCHVVSWDDAICIKSSSADVCRNIVISNCTVSSLCNAIKLGTESNGGFENIAISNCTVEGGEMNGWHSINGVALMIVDGGVMNGIRISNIVMKAVRTALFIHLGNRARPYSPDHPVRQIGTLKNVHIDNLTAEVIDADYCSSITGMPGHLLEDIVLDNVTIRSPGGLTHSSSQAPVPEKPAAYPESIMFGPMSASGLYCRHVKGLTLRNVTLRLATPDRRTAIACENVEEFSLVGLEASNLGPDPLIRLTDVRDVLIQASRARAQLLLAVEGENSSEIALLSNDLRHVNETVAKRKDFTGTIVQAGNIGS